MKTAGFFRVLLLLTAGLWAGSPAAFGERMEMVTYFDPAAPGGGVGPTSRLHADRGTIGPPYASVPDGQVPDGMLFVQEALGVGMPLESGGIALPGARLEVFGLNQANAPALAVDRGAAGEDFQGILIWAEDRDAFIRYEENASEATPGRLHFQTTVAGGPVGENLVLSGFAGVGVGTDDPNGILHVSDGGTFLPGLDGTETVIVQSNEAAAAGAGVAVISGADGSAGVRFGDSAVSNRAEVRYRNGLGRLELATAGNPAVMITDAGSVGVGGEPEATLQVEGGIHFAGGNGDVNGDGYVTAIDVLNMINALNDNQVGSLPPGQYAAADISGDGRVNGTDVMLLVGIMNGQLTLAQAKSTGRSIEAQAFGVTPNGTVVIGASAPAEWGRLSSAKLAVNSTTGGFLPPRVATAQRDGITDPAPGLMIYNTDLRKLQYFDHVEGIWKTVGPGSWTGGGSPLNHPDFDSGWLYYYENPPVIKLYADHNLGVLNTLAHVQTRTNMSSDVRDVAVSVNRSRYWRNQNEPNRVYIPYGGPTNAPQNPYFRIRLWKLGDDD